MRRQPKPTVNRGPKDSEPSMPKLGKRKHPMPAVAETVGDSDDSSSSSSSSSSSESSSDSSDSDSGKTSSLSDNSTRRRRRYRSRRKRYYKSTRRSKSRSKMKKNKHGEENLALTPVRAVKHEPDLDPTEFAIWSPVQSRAVQSILESGNKSRSASLVKEKKPITPNKAKKKPELEKPAATTSTKPKETKSKDKDRESRSSTSFRGKHSPIRNPKKLVSPLRSAVITIDKSQPYTTPRPKDNNKEKDKENDKDKSQRSKRHYTDNMSKKKRSSSRSSSRSRDGRSKKTREMLLRAVTVTRDSPGSRRRSPVSFNSNRSKDTRSIMRSPSKLRNMRSSSRTADNRGRRDRRSVSRSNLRITFENRRSRSRSANSSPARYRLFSPEPVNNLRLHIRGLTRQVTKLDIIDIFSHYGPLTNVDFPMERYHGNGFNRYGRGFAFVQFENADDCEMARKNMDGGRVDGKTISVTPFDKNLLRYPMRRRFDSPTRDRCFN